MKPTPDEIVAAAAELREKKDAYDLAHARASRADADERDAQAAMQEASNAYHRLTDALVTED